MVVFCQAAATSLAISVPNLAHPSQKIEVLTQLSSLLVVVAGSLEVEQNEGQI
jgi:hypothetical protein